MVNNLKSKNSYIPSVYKALMTALFIIIPAMMYLLNSYWFQHYRNLMYTGATEGNVFQFFGYKFGDEVTCIVVVVICSIVGMILTWLNKPDLIMIPTWIYFIFMICSIHTGGEYIHYYSYGENVYDIDAGPTPAYWLIWISVVALVVINIVAIRKKRYVSNTQYSFNSDTVSVAQSQPPDTLLDQINKLKQLKQLLDDGALTQEEYDSKKKQILDGK